MASLPTFPMDINAIQKCIPHRYPFLLIDRVTEAVPSKSLVAIRNVSNADPILQGHFPDNPVVPGVLVVEAMAQAAAVLGHLSKPEGLSTCLLTEVSSARFRRQIVPGDVMRFEIIVGKQRHPFFWFEGTCSVDAEVAAQVSFSALMK